MSTSSKRLFKGQNNHPLSPAEKKAFAQKLQFDESVSPEDKKKVYAALKEMMAYPTGREQIRKIIAYEKKSYKINIAGGLGSVRGASGEAGISLGKQILDNSKQTGITFLHEMLHQRQKYRYADNLNVDQEAGYETLVESETQALSRQMEIEAGHDVDVMYKESYEKNLAKWRKIATGKQKRPQGIPPLVYAKGLTPAEKAQAREAYAQQLASLETRAIATKEFVKPIDELDESLQSYHNVQKNLGYMRGSMNAVYNVGRFVPGAYKNPAGNTEAYQQFLNNIASRNHLFLTVDDLKKATISGNNDKEKVGFMTIAREAQARYAKGEGENFAQVFDKILAEKQKEGKPVEKFTINDNKLLNEFFQKEFIPAQNSDPDPIKARINVNEAIMKSEIIDDIQKRERLLYFIRTSKNQHPKKREDRTDAIKKLRELTGNPNLPIVKEASVDPQIKDSLRKAQQKPFDPQQEVIENIPLITDDKSFIA